MAWLSTGYLYPRVRLDNARMEDAFVEVDGARPLRIRAGDMTELSLRAGQHRFDVRYADEAEPEALTLFLPKGTPHLLALDGWRCFEIVREEDTRPHRWSNYTQHSLSSSTTRGRWISIGTGTTVSRAPCPAHSDFGLPR